MYDAFDSEVRLATDAYYRRVWMGGGCGAFKYRISSELLEPIRRDIENLLNNCTPANLDTEVQAILTTHVHKDHSELLKWKSDASVAIAEQK